MGFAQLTTSLFGSPWGKLHASSRHANGKGVPRSGDKPAAVAAPGGSTCTSAGGSSHRSHGLTSLHQTQLHIVSQRLAVLRHAASSRIARKDAEVCSPGGEASPCNGTAVGRAARAPCIPPLPYWCDGVAVVGLPNDELVFCFQTPTQAAATARRQLRPEAPFGRAAAKLAVLPADKAQAILDRWQYAVAQQELGSLSRAGLLWWRYESAMKTGQQMATAASTHGSESSNGTVVKSADEPMSGAQGKEAQALTRRQRKRAAKLAKAAAAAAAKQLRRQERLLRRQEAALGASGHSSDSVSDSQAAASSSGGSSSNGSGSGRETPLPSEGYGQDWEWQEQPAAPVAPLIHPSAYEHSWELCTVRGLPLDGAVIYKFGGQEPLPDALPDAGIGAGAGWFGSGDVGGEEEGEEAQLKRRILWQQLLRAQEGVSWSCALRLGSMTQPGRSLDKLQAFVCDWVDGASRSKGLNVGLYPTYDVAWRKAQQRAARLGWLPAAGPEQQGQQEEWQSVEQAGQRLWDEQGRRELQRGQSELGQEQREEQQAELALLSASQASDNAPVVEEGSISTTTSTSSEVSSPDMAAEVAAGQAAAKAEEGGWQSQLPLGLLWDEPQAEQRQQQSEKENVQQQQQQQQLQVEEETDRQEPQQQQQVEDLRLALQGLAADTPSRSAEEAAAPSQPQQEPAPKMWLLAAYAAMAAQAARLAAAVQGLASGAMNAVVSGVTALYRRLPVAFRRMFWPSWPPQWAESHVSGTLASVVAGSATPQQLARAGFDSQGRTTAPLADLQAWRVERLTLCAVRDLDLYRAAFTHKSALLPEERTARSFERLEFLGDSVLGLTCRNLLMRYRPHGDEGELTKLQSVVVSGVAAAKYAAWLGLDRYVLMELKSLREAAQHTPAVLADVFEALLGAIFLDQGFAAAQRFCTRVLHAAVDWEQLEAAEDWKGLLSRYAAMNGKPQPRYSVAATSQREYKAGLALKYWMVDVVFKGEVMGSGSSFDKRQAEQEAARQALRQLGELP